MASKTRAKTPPVKRRWYHRTLSWSADAITSARPKTIVGALVVIALFSWARTGGLDAAERTLRAAADGVHAFRASLARTFADQPTGSVPN